MSVNSSPPGQNGRRFPDRIFKWMNETLWIAIQLSLRRVPEGPVDNKSALARAMAWRRTGDKPLPEPMLTYA